MDTGFLKLLSRLEINNTTFDDVLDNGLADMTNGLGLVTIIGQHLKFYNQKFNNKPKPYGNDDIEREGTSRTQIGESGGNIPPVGPGGGGVSGRGAANPKEVNIHGKLNTELDEVDLANKVIYEDKPASKLYMDNPDYPQTEQDWAYKQIFKKGANRIETLQQADIKLSSTTSQTLPSVEEIQGIKNYVFRIDADTPALRQAVQHELNNLKAKYPDYNFSATFGGNE